MPKPEKVTGPSGRVYDWTQPPRHVHWKHGRAGRTYAAKVQEIVEGEEPDGQRTDEERAFALFESMSDAELARLEAYADDLLTSGLGHPPGDMPEQDYWFFWVRAVYGAKAMPVETAEGVTTVRTVESFPAEPGLPSTGENVPDVRPAPEPVHGDMRAPAG